MASSPSEGACRHFRMACAIGIVVIRARMYEKAGFVSGRPGTGKIEESRNIKKK